MNTTEIKKDEIPRFVTKTPHIILLFCIASIFIFCLWDKGHKMTSHKDMPTISSIPISTSYSLPLPFTLSPWMNLPALLGFMFIIILAFHNLVLYETFTPYTNSYIHSYESHKKSCTLDSCYGEIPGITVIVRCFIPVLSLSSFPVFISKEWLNLFHIGLWIAGTASLYIFTILTYLLLYTTTKEKKAHNFVQMTQLTNITLLLILFASSLVSIGFLVGYICSLPLTLFTIVDFFLINNMKMKCS